MSVYQEAQEGCGGLREENPGAFPKAVPIFQQPFSLSENAQTLAGTTLGAARESVKTSPAALKFAGKLFQQGISDSHGLLQFSECMVSSMVSRCESADFRWVPYQDPIQESEGLKALQREASLSKYSLESF